MTALDAEARERLAAATVWLTRRYPYLALAVHALHVVPADIGTFAVDRRWRLYVDPRCLADWSVQEVGGVLCHEVWHVLRDHAQRAEALGVGPDEHVRWNIAADAEINDDLVGDDVPLPGAPVTPATLNQPPHQLAETYYQQVRIQRQVDCGSGGDGLTRPYEVAEAEAPAVGDMEGELVRRETAQQIRDAGRAAGSLPGSWQRWAEGVLEPRVDWRRLLRAEVRRGLAWARGAADHSWSRPSRRAAALPGVVLPSLRRPLPTVAVVVDTSGSVDGDMLAQALAEVDGCLREMSVSDRQVTVLACDSEVQAAGRVRSARDVVLAGGGGTDMRVGLEQAAELRPKPDLAVVLTDGCTPWPDEPPPGCRVVVGLLEGGAEHEVPAWATVVRAHA